jgi:PAS domain S-box-containing protein
LYKQDQHVLVNPAYNQLFGYKEDELFGKSFLNLIIPDQRDTIKYFASQQTRKGFASSAYETRGIRKDGAEFMMEVHASVYMVDDEFYTIALIRDITERKLAEYELRRLNRALKTINESEQAISHAVNEMDLYKDICRIICQNGGYSMAWVGFLETDQNTKVNPIAWYIPDENLINPEYHQQISQVSLNPSTLTALRNGQTVRNSNIQIKTPANKTGSLINIPLRISLENEVFGVFSIYASETNAFDPREIRLLQDLSEEMVYGMRALQTRMERDRAEATLRESEERFRTTFEQVAVGVAHVAPTGYFMRVNQWFCDILGYSQEELTRLKFNQITHPDFIKQDLVEIQRLLDGKSDQYSIDKQYIRKDNSTLWAHLTLSALREEDGGVKFFTAIIEDISERKKIEKALEEERQSLAHRVEERTAELKLANAELARAARLKDEFLASMSHELRTPLTSILGLTEALQKQVYGELNEKQTRSLQYVEESGHHLLSLINDILDLSKIEAGKFVLELEPVSLESICQASLQFIKQNAHKKQISISHIYDEKIGMMMADSRRLKQIMVNLLSNAVKFTPEGGKVGLDVAGDAENRQILITVWDTGIGIDEKDFASLFQPFVQLDSRLSRNFEGTGLGLSLVQRLVLLHGGAISVESKLNQGSRFTFTIPWQLVKA